MRDIRFYIILLLNLTLLYGNWTVSPMTLSYALSENSSSTDVIWVKNPTDDTLIVSVTVKDYIKENGVDIMKQARTTERSCAGWLFINPEIVEVFPYQNKEIRVDLSVPKGAYGDYWSMLYIEQISKPRPKLAEYGKMKLNVSTNFRWGVRVKQHVPGSLERSGKITEMTFDDETKNIGLHFFNDSKLINERSTGWIEIRDEDGETISKIPISSFTIYPNDERIFNVEIPSELEPGEYSAVGIIDFGGDHLVGGEILFNIRE